MKKRHRSVFPTLVLSLVLGAALLLPQGGAGAQGPAGTEEIGTLDLVDLVDAGPAPEDFWRDSEPREMQAPGEDDGTVRAASYSSSFTYQGRLLDGGQPAKGTYDLQFSLHDAETDGSQIGAVVTKQNLAVSDGLFTVVLDFGGNALTGGARYLEIGVRPGDSAGSFTVLTPRRAITPTPYASFAFNADRLDGRDSSSFASANHDHDDRYYLKQSGTQFTDTLSAGQTRTYFTFNWPTDEIVYWSVHPTTTNGRVEWIVEIRLADTGQFIYYLTITNTGSVTTSVAAKYVVFR
jgi:hypothetical protein